ncbi:MAG TPA: glycosyltransferase family 2 protein [Oscillatoriales cyanobacterium M59_W2019_021]|nr:glycosyltransferase family 2 protein [Oscillatoriales cyanobacterium M4454_W2019_049]HIK50973.1 glycosyltransferase family 2 protein [Oscillatoriales cyanobacterium M59_W2019_021]
MPKVSVCIPTYNRAELLSYAVESTLKQTYTDLELIICDDGSTDNTPERVLQWNDPRIRYIRHPQNIGRSRNMRSGFEAATGEYFIKFDDDDALATEFLEKTVAILENDSTLDFVCTNHWIIDRQSQRIESATRENSEKWGKDKLQKGFISDLLTETFVYQSLQVGSTLFRRQALADVDYMRAQADGCEDFDLFVRLALAGKQGYFLPEFLMEYRIHSGQTSLKQDIHFLKAKQFCLNSYQFSDANLENIRIGKLGAIQQTLGLRSIEQGNTAEGRKLLQESDRLLGRSRKSQMGRFLSYLPLSLRRLAFQFFRQWRPQTYSDRVRDII